MSYNSENKAKKERKLLEDAIRLSKSATEQTKIIMSYLDGDVYSREIEECPDMIRICLNNKPPHNKVFVGIEHFFADQVSKKKGDKIVSAGEQHLNAINNTREHGLEMLLHEGTIGEFYMKELATRTFDYAADITSSGYESFLLSFENAISKHVSKADKYLHELNKCALGKPVELVFFIEVSFHLQWFFANDSNGIFKPCENEFVFVTPIVNALSKIPKDKVKYIVIFARDSVSKKPNFVGAFPAGNIRKHIQDQGFIIYELCDSKIKLRAKRRGDPIFDAADHSFRIDHERIVVPNDTDGFGKANSDGYKSAYYCQKKHIPFIAPRIIQLMLYTYGRNVSFKNGQLISSFPREMLLNRAEEFNRMYPTE